MIYRFEGFELDTARYELRRDGGPVALERQVFDVLAYLIANHERMVAKEELLDKIWGDRFVSEAALNSRVMAARKAIGDSGKEQRLIKTVHGRGYRFVGEVQLPSPTGGQSADRSPAVRTGAPDRRPPAPPAPAIEYARTRDGVDIAHWSAGEGRPLVVMPDWIWSHVGSELKLDPVISWYTELWSRWRLVRYDGRGEGLSDRDATDYSLTGRVMDLEAVVERQSQPVALLAHVSSTLTAIAFAAEHPEQVTHLVLWCGYSRAEEFGDTAQLRALTALLRHDWDLYVENIVRARAVGWTSRLDTAAFARYLRDAAGPDYALAAMESLLTLDVSGLLEKVRTPALVIHCSGVMIPSIDASRRLAAALPNARLCVLEGDAPVPHLGDTGPAIRVLEDFLGT